MIKLALDTIRADRDYAGMAIYYCGKLFFADQIDVAYVSRLMRLFSECEQVNTVENMYVVTGGFTFHRFMLADYQLVARFTGRFAIRPDIPVSNSDFIDPDPVHGLPLRDTARQMAEDLLREYGL